VRRTLDASSLSIEVLSAVMSDTRPSAGRISSAGALWRSPGSPVPISRRECGRGAPHHRRRSPAAVAHDGQLGRALGVALGGEAGAKGVTGEGAVEADGQCAALDHVGHRPVAEARGSQAAVTIDGSERRGPCRCRIQQASAAMRAPDRSPGDCCRRGGRAPCLRLLGPSWIYAR